MVNISIMYVKMYDKALEHLNTHNHYTHNIHNLPFQSQETNSLVRFRCSSNTTKQILAPPSYAHSKLVEIAIESKV